MAETSSDAAGNDGRGPGIAEARRRGRRLRRIGGIVGLSLLILILVAVAAVWIARRPIASNVLEREFEARGVQASYDLERVGLRTQVVRNLVIGDPKDPDLVARYALIQLRVKWNGSVEVYRVMARGVRLEGRVVDGKISWGELDRLMPEPGDEPFRLPDLSVDVADASISLQTPAGPLGLALSGSGNLTGGFDGRVAVRSPGLDFGDCRLAGTSAFFDVAVTARRPHVEGPLAADRFVCPQANLALAQPRFVVDARFNEAFDDFDGSARLSARQLIAGDNGLAGLNGRISFEGDPGKADGRVELAARRSRLGPVLADRTRIAGRYQLDARAGTMGFLGQFDVDDSQLAPALIADITNPLAGLSKTPLGPIASSIARALRQGAGDFDANGRIALVNAKDSGFARIDSLNLRTATGGQVRLAGGDGVTYRWPDGAIRFDTQVRMGGGGLPTGQLVLRQPKAGGPITGTARLRPYRVGETVLAFGRPVRFRAAPDGSTEFGTLVQLSGPFSEGRVRDLRLPVEGRFGGRGGFQIGRGCLTASFDYLQFRDLQLGPTRLPVCPAGQSAILAQGPNGELSIGARIDRPSIRGRLGSSPLRLDAASARLTGGEDFSLANAVMRLGDPDSPVIVEAERLQGTFSGAGVSGTLSGGEVIIGSVPLLLSDVDGNWRFRSGDLLIDGDLMVSDRSDDPRFYPLQSRDFQFRLSGNDIDAGGTLRHPESGTLVTQVDIDHDLGTGAGQALLDVPGLTFGEGLQPEELTRLTEGVVALVRGTIRGEGRIAWSSDGETVSTGTFSTQDMDLAAPFGPVEGLSTTINFTDLLNLETAPGQVARIAGINPGIAAEDGVITYQLLSDSRVKIERGVWPFMGGQLILHETILNFGRPTAKRLTFEVVGLDSAVFVESLGIDVLEMSGIFDGVLPMIFDDSGGRIVGGRLDSRQPGGLLAYRGEAEGLGLGARLAVNALRELHYRDMIIRLDGDLAGEFAVRVTIDHIRLGDSTVATILRALTRKLRFKFNIAITGPLRSVIQTMRSLDDPSEIISPVMPFPLDAPGVITQTRRIEEETQAREVEPERTTETPPEPSGTARE